MVEEQLEEVEGADEEEGADEKEVEEEGAGEVEEVEGEETNFVAFIEEVMKTRRELCYISSCLKRYKRAPCFSKLSTDSPVIIR